jgi:hypothetical protein
MRRRGAAILALVRLLAARRPVELWTISTLDNGRSGGSSFFVACRLDSAPLDIARAAHVLSHAGHDRHIHHAISRSFGSYSGGWAYARADTSGIKRHLKTSIMQAMPHLSDALVISPAWVGDQIASDPHAWVQQQLDLHTQAQALAA